MRGFNYHMLCAFLSLGTLSLKAAKVDFARDIRPVLSDACYNCHGPDKKARKAKLRLDDRKTAVESGVFSDGEMLARLTSTDPDERMPPPDSNRVLNPADRAKLVSWLKAGGDWPEDDRHWAFVSPGLSLIHISEPTRQEAI